MDAQITGVELTQLKRIAHPNGDVYHGMKASDTGFQGFGEKHREMTLNFMVPVGEIKVVVYDDRGESETKGNFFEVILSHQNYQRITIAPGLWVAFSGVGNGMNLLLNIASLEHDPLEIDRLELSDIHYNWNE
jgi:dTDP-4-dehydrorhamnose 3,5-epimerase